MKIIQLLKDTRIFIVLWLSSVVNGRTYAASILKSEDRNKVQNRPPPIKPRIRDPIKSAVPESFFTAPLNCNPHPYSFTINQRDVCLNEPEVFLLMLIRTIYNHTDRRQVIRHTWGNQRNVPRHKVILVFLFGASNDKMHQRGIEEESRRYGDIVQENFLDSYQNLTLKDVMAFKWASTFCQHANFVMVGSDEIVVDVFKLVSFLETAVKTTLAKELNSKFTLCHLYPCCTMVHREHPKYSADLAKYTGNAYPRYCSGTAYIATSDVIAKLYAMSWDTPSFMPDDAWIGVLAEKLNLTFHDSYRSFSGIRNHPTIRRDFNDPGYIRSQIMVGVLDYDFPTKEATYMKLMWQKVLKHHEANTFSSDLWKGTYMAQPHSAESGEANDIQFAFAFGVILDAVIFCAMFACCFWLRRKYVYFFLDCFRNYFQNMQM